MVEKPPRSQVLDMMTQASFSTGPFIAALAMASAPMSILSPAVAHRGGGDAFPFRAIQSAANA